MSDLFPTLLPETHKPELMAGTSTLSYGGGLASPPSEVGVSMAGAGRAAEAASFTGGMPHDASTQLDLIQARAASTVELTARLGISAAQSGSNPSILREGSVETENAAGQAVAALLGMNGTPSSATQVGQQDALPKLQFLSAETAIQAVSPVVANQRAENELSSSAKSEAAPLPPSATSIPSPDAPTSLWDLEEDQQESDQTPHSRLVRSTGYTYDPSNGAFNGSYDYTPGGVINDYPSIDWNFLGGGGGGYVPLPTHGSTPDSGPPIPPYKPGDTGERIRTVEEIKQQALEIYGVEANENHIHFVQIQQRKLVTWDSLRNWLAHDDVAKNALVKVIEQTQGRPYDARDDEWIAVHQNEIGIDGKSLLQVRQELARWTAEHGGYDTLYRHAHNRAPTEADRAYAATMIGNGWTAKDYLWNEIHGEAAAREYADTYRQVHGREPSAADIQFAQQKISNGASLQRYRWDEAHNGQTAQEFGDVFRQVHGREPTGADIQFAQDKIGNGASRHQYRWEEAHNGQAAQEFGDVFRQVHGREPTGADIQFAQDRIGNGASRQQYRWDEAHSDAVANQLRDIIPAVQGRPYQESDAGWVKARQDDLGNGNQTPAQIRQALARWFADNGGYDPIYIHVHGYAPSNEDRNRIALLMGSGATIRDYRWQEAHSSLAAQNYRDVYHNMTGNDPTAEELRAIQDHVSDDGASIQDARRDLAFSSVGRATVQAVYARTAGIQNPEQLQYDVYQKDLANGASVADITRKLAYSWEGHDAVQKAFARTAGIQNPTQSQYDWYQRALATGSSTSDITGGIARAWEGESAVRKAYNEAGGITPSDEQIRSWVNGLAQGTSYTDMRGTIAHNEGSVALKDIAFKVLGRTLSPEELATQQAELTNGKTLADLRHAAAFSQEATNRLTQQTADLIHKAGIEQGLVWSGVPEALAGLQGNIAAGQATMGQVQTAIARCMFATCFPGSTTTPASVLQEFSAIAARGTATAAEGMSAAAMAESAAAIIGEIVADAVATPVAVTAAALWPQPTNQFYDPNGNAISESTWVQRENLRQNVIAQIKDDKTFVWTGNLGGGEDPNDKLQVHHCVPIKMDTAQAARDILDKWQIGINDPANASIIPRSFHFSNEIHGGQGAQKDYGDLISQYMERADEFAESKSQSLGGGDAGFKAGRADLMESLRRFCDNLTYKSKDPNAIVFQEIMRNVEKGARQIVNGN